jgi:purine-binding chemotaxis protein CheW
MSERMQLVVFRVDEQRYALALDAVARIVRAVEVTPLPGAPHIVLGVIDVEGSVLPVLSIRRRFQVPQREIAPTDQFLIAWAAGRAVALVIDEVQGVMEREQSAVTPSHGIAPGLEQFEGIVTLDDGLVLIHDPQKFLSLDDARALDDAMDRAE